MGMAGTQLANNSTLLQPCKVNNKNLGCDNGLKIVIDEVLPKVKHRNCTRHATIERVWEDKVANLKKKDEKTAKELMSESPKQWTKSFFGCPCKSDMVDNNICKAFKSSNVKATYESIITMLKEIKVRLMIKIVEKQKFSKSWKQN
ncbi:hypothetical protein J1N35_014425 [Gossypium stocksii]|uniref:Uncharacterized protein n=1 Tax=Gossypium stocksii TaxID=47602 RepID=A0A9D4A9C2_9ROSI|nr:hypothetical protein J1N35_014425 [Gossypium stocksii]